MTEPLATDEEDQEPASGCVQVGESIAAAEARVSRNEKRKAAKKEKRKQIRKELAEKTRAEEEARLNDPEEQQRIKLEEERENERLERERREFEERERLFLEELARKKAVEEELRKRFEEEEESNQNPANLENDSNKDEDWEYVEEGPPEIIWQGNEIIVKKKKVRVKKQNVDVQSNKEDVDRPTSNPLPPQSEVFADYNNAPIASAQQLLDDVAQQVPNFGTEQDKAHCPFHIKTGACRFGIRCSRVHFYPDKSCTLLFKNMYNGPGLAWEQDEGLEHTDEEVERCYEEFYEDVHTELLKFGEIVNFKVCRNGSFHLRGNVYVHYKSLDSAVLAYRSTNGRYFAGKQVNCEFVSVTKWKVAICGEYMKSRFKTCSRGTACNFIHCFRNPGGDYEWADWDKPPPRYWTRKMVSLFGFSDESSLYDKNQIEQEERDRYYYRRSKSRDRDYLNSNSSRSHHTEHEFRRSSDRKKNNTRTNDDTDSDGGYWSDRAKKRKKHNGDDHSTRKSSKHQKVTSETPNDSRTGREAYSDEDFLDEKAESRHHRRERNSKSPRKWDELFISPDSRRRSSSRMHDDREYTGVLSEDYADFEKERERRYSSNSTKWGSSTQNLEAHLQDDCLKYNRYNQRSNSHEDLDLRYDREENIKKSGKRKRSKGSKSHDDKSPSSRGRYNQRSNSRDSPIDKHDDEMQRWKPETDSPKTKLKSRSRDDESRSRGNSGRSSHRKRRMESLDKMDSPNELQEYQCDKKET